ncbi:amino acid adenylation domain-containing protein [Sorangium sp. So ce295]|uniref:amino acid adenylation domain-containing protein n=1 Tax=Sorangium sp. So ce295 TaxID=3133295 RepID=UPI003F63F594
MTYHDFSSEDASIHRSFELQAGRTPGVVAASFGPDRLTYQELNRRANQLAHHLRSLGVGRDVLVALCAERSLEALVGLLAVLKAGGAYVPVDPSYPRERVAFMLEDAKAPVLLTQARLLPSLPRHAARVVLLDGDRGVTAGFSDEDPPDTTGPDDLAYVIYTSGSTGRPKGAQLVHRGLTNLARALAERFDVGPGCRVLQFASLSFDASVWEIAMTLARGGTLVMGTKFEMIPGRALLDRMRAEEVAIATFPPSALAAFPEGAERSLPALRTLIVAGESCPADLAARWAEGRTFINAYGPTESTVCATMADGLDPDRDPGEPLSIGRPIRNTRCFVLDAAMRPVPDGESGELYLGGPGLARGYLGQPELTAARFVPDPFSALPEARLYRTGDVVRRLPGGDLAFLGRVDQQVKIRGHRVELGEVEAALGRHPAVRAAVAVASEGRLVAYVVARPDAPDAPPAAPRAVVPALRSFLRESLPEVMIPSTFVRLDALPLGPSGKVDRAALPPPDAARPDRGDGEPLAPRNQIEAAIAAAWADALGIERIGVHDDVFDLGAHSLLAARVLSRLRRALGVDLSLQSLCDAPTVAALADLVASLPRPKQRPAAAAIPPAPRDRPIPLSHGQRQIWLHAALHPGALFYNEPFSLRLRGPLDVPALGRALDELLRRHEILRSVVAVVRGEPVQQIQPPAPLDLPVVDLTALPALSAETRWERAVALATDEARRPFDLARGPLLRATLVRLDEAEHVLFVVVHHILMDGVSIFDVLPRELHALYQAFAAGRPSPLPERAIHYADYAGWQREQQLSGAHQPQLDYWRRQLADLPTLELPTDRPRPAAPNLAGARHCVALSRELTLRLKALAREQGVTLFVVLLSAFKAMLCRYARQDEIVVGTSASCRHPPETEDLLGFFLNTLVLRTDLRGDPTFRQLLGRVRAVSQAALSHQDVPFASVVEALQSKRVPGQNPLFQVAFILEPPVPAIDPGWTLGQLDVDTGASKFDLTLELDEREDGIIGRIEYSAALFDARTIERMAGHYETLLDGASRDVDLPLSALPLLTPEERSALRAWGTAPAGPGSDVCIHRLFEAQVERSPEAVAVVFDDGAGNVTSLTYRELNRRANQLAHTLLGLRVREAPGSGAAPCPDEGALAPEALAPEALAPEALAPEDRVAVCMYRSIEMLVALLGVLKAGLAFVPLDPTYPTDRLAFMMEQARARVMLTQARVGEALPGCRARVLCLDADREEIGRARDDNPSAPATPDQLAYVMYTSGSTGRPKGVAVPHRGVARLVKGTTYASFAPDEVFLQLASISFDTSQFEIWGALLNGGRLVVMPPVPASLDDLDRVIRQHGVTTVWLTAGVFHLLVDERITALRGLRQIVAGGDVLSPQHVNRVLAELPGCRMISGYGPTEAATFACCATVERPVGHAVPIGRPISGTRVHVLDQELNEVPAGVPGELCIGGEGLARGYLDLPELTAERFIPDPIGGGPEGRLYRTGDRVRLMPDGQLEFLGRMDQQVKVRGYQIELGEIEVVLGEHPGVREAVVVAQPARSGDRRLVAYVVPHGSRAAAPPRQAGARARPFTADPTGGLERTIRDHAQRRLPDYMHPSAIVLLDALPLAGNGEVDRRALPAPGELRPESAPMVAPRSSLEERLIAIWQDVLGIERVSVHDNFFDLGGHSLLLVRLHERVRESFGSDLSLVDIFARPTVTDLAAFLASSSGRGSELSAADARALKQREILKRKKQAAKSRQNGSA